MSFEQKPAPLFGGALQPLRKRKQQVHKSWAISRKSHCLESDKGRVEGRSQRWLEQWAGSDW